MKTKFLLGAMALPLFIAACSQEDIVNEDSLTNLGERKTVDVTISLDEETMSRMAFVGGETPYAWETGDQFGAALMDVPANGAAYPNYTVGFWSRFDLVDYIHTNYPFTRQSDGNWTSEAVMSEGNYFFYYPYNNNLGGRRSALKLEIPTEQVLADGAKASSALDQQLFVGYSSVQAKEGKEKESISLKMEPLLAFPGFRLKSSGNSTEAITIRKIAYHSGEETFPLYYEVKPATAVKNTDASGIVTSSAFNAYNYENANQSQATKRANIVKIAQAGGETNQVSLTFGEYGKTLKAGQSTLGYIMLPPMTKTAAKLYIYTDKGLGVADLSKANVDAGTAATNISNDRALTKIEYNDNAIVNIEFDNTAFAQPFYMQVRSTDELVDLVKWSRNNTKAVLNAELMNDKIVLDPQVVSILKNSASNGWDLTLNIRGNMITVPSNTVNDALLTKLNLAVNNIVIAQGANVKLPALSGSYVDETKNSKAYSVTKVLNYGTVELVNNKTAPDFYNEGTLTITGKDTNGDGVKESSVQKIENKGIVNSSATGTIAALNNTKTGKANFNAGKVTIAQLSNVFDDNGGSAYKRGEITIAKGAKLAVTAGSNEGLVTVNGELSGALLNNVNNTDNLNGKMPMEIPSEIKNGGKVTGITNYGLVTMTSASAHQQTGVAKKGYVNNNVESPYIIKVANEIIFVQFEGSYKASEVAKKVVKTNARQLRLSGEFTADPVADGDGWSYIIGEQDELEVVANGNLDINGQVCFYSKDKTQNTRFEVNVNTVTDVTTNSYLWLGNGTLCVDGEMNINNGAKVKAMVNETSKNNINIYGTLENTAASSNGNATVDLTAGTASMTTGTYLAEIKTGTNDVTIGSATGRAEDVVINGQIWSDNNSTTVKVSNVTLTGEDLPTVVGTHNYRTTSTVYDHYGRVGNDYVFEGVVFDLEDGNNAFKSWHSAGNVTFKNCKFNSSVSPIQINSTGTVTVENCEFDGSADAAVTLSGKGGKLIFKNNVVKLTYAVKMHKDWSTGDWVVETEDNTKCAWMTGVDFESCTVAGNWKEI